MDDRDNKEIKTSDEKLNEAIKTKLYEMYSKGMLIGAKTMCKTILDELNTPKTTNTQKLATIRKFCMIALRDDKKNIKKDIKE